MPLGLDAGAYRWGSGWDLSWAIQHSDGLEMSVSDEAPVRMPTIMTLRSPSVDSAELVITGKPVRRGNTYVWDLSESQVKLIGAQCAQAVLNWPVGEVPFQ